MRVVCEKWFLLLARAVARYRQRVGHFNKKTGQAVGLRAIVARIDFL
jgi:hypothetical protein